MVDFLEEIEQFLASFSPDEVAVTRHAFQAILAGQPAKVTELPVALSLPADQIHAVVGHLTERGTLVVELENEQVVGVRHLS